MPSKQQKNNHAIVPRARPQRNNDPAVIMPRPQRNGNNPAIIPRLLQNPMLVRGVVFILLVWIGSLALRSLSRILFPGSHDHERNEVVLHFHRGKSWARLRVLTEDAKSPNILAHTYRNRVTKQFSNSEFSSERNNTSPGPVGPPAFPHALLLSLRSLARDDLIQAFCNREDSDRPFTPTVVYYSPHLPTTLDGVLSRERYARMHGMQHASATVVSTALMWAVRTAANRFYDTRGNLFEYKISAPYISNVAEQALLGPSGPKDHEGEVDINIDLHASVADLDRHDIRTYARSSRQTQQPYHFYVQAKSKLGWVFRDWFEDEYLKCFFFSAQKPGWVNLMSFDINLVGFEEARNEAHQVNVFKLAVPVSRGRGDGVFGVGGVEGDHVVSTEEISYSTRFLVVQSLTLIISMSDWLDCMFPGLGGGGSTAKGASESSTLLSSLLTPDQAWAVVTRGILPLSFSPNPKRANYAWGMVLGQESLDNDGGKNARATKSRERERKCDLSSSLERNALFRPVKNFRKKRLRHPKFGRTGASITAAVFQGDGVREVDLLSVLEDMADGVRERVKG